MAAGFVDTIPVDVAYVLALEETVQRATELRKRTDRFAVQSLLLTAAAIWGANIYTLLHALS